MRRDAGGFSRSCSGTGRDPARGDAIEERASDQTGEYTQFDGDELVALVRAACRYSVLPRAPQRSSRLRLSP
jgi:hypothetical protein